MPSNTTAVCYSAKAELACGGHSFLATNTGQSCTAATTTAMTAMSVGIAGLALGMAISGTNAGAGAVVSSLDSQTSLKMSVASSGALTAPTFTADVFKFLLLISTASRAYSGTQTNVGTPGTGAGSVTNVGTDEVANGLGYTTGGVTLVNISPAVGTTAAFWSFTTNPSWSSATFSTTGGIIYNTTVRMGAAANGITANAAGSAINRAFSVHDFGGTQTVAGGTFTVVLPTNAQGTAILQLS